MNTKTNKCITISEELLKRDSLSKTNLIIYGLLLKYASGNKCTISNKRLGEMLNLTGKSISRSLTALENEGLIRREIIRNRDNSVLERNIYIT